MLIRVKVAICLKRGFYVLMPQPVSNQQWGKTLFNQKGSVGVAQIMNPDPLYP